MKLTLFGILTAGAVLLAPTAAQQRAQPSVPDGVRVIRDIEYGRTPEKRLLLDIYLPETGLTEPRPLIVWIHGGGWRRGSKDRTQASRYVPQGYIVASISYRLSGDAIFPAQIQDSKAAIRWLRANAGDYHIDPGRIGVWGSSAGGHLVALVGTSGGVAELEGDTGNLDQSSRVQAVVDYFGPTDFVQMDAHSISDKLIHDNADSPESLLVGGPIQQNKEMVAKANPITYVSSDDPPFLIVHGDEDPLVPHHQSELLLAALQKAGVPSQLFTVKGGGHGSGFNIPEVHNTVRQFFEKHLKK